MCFKNPYEQKWKKPPEDQGGFHQINTMEEIKDYIEFLACIFAIRVPDDLLYSASEIA